MKNILSNLVAPTVGGAFRSALAGLIFAGAASIASAQERFASIYHPNGIAVTPTGEIASYADFVSSHGFKFFLPTGQLSGTVPLNGSASGWNIAGQIASGQLGGFGDTAGMCRLAVAREWGNTILGLRQDGGIIWYDRQAQEGGYWINLRTLPTITHRIYDVARRTTGAMQGQVSNVNASYGDIAFVAGTTASGRAYQAIYATGLSYPGVFPFIQRVRFYGNGTYDSKIIVASSATTAGALNNARGVAVNRRGIVAAVLPYQSSAGGADRLFMFNSDFDETGRNLPAMKLGGQILGGEGMCSDSAGNFYIATGKLGISAGGRSYSGALVVVNPTGSSGQIFPANSNMMDSRDVALSPDERFAYVNALQNSVILRFQVR